MQKTREALEKAAFTLDRYQKNKMYVTPEDLAGKYKNSFERLKMQLKEELEQYLRLFILEGIQIIDNAEGQQAIAEINQAWQDADVGRQIGRAAFLEFDIEKIKLLAQEHRQKVQGIYQTYLQRLKEKEDNHEQTGECKEI